MRTTGQANTRSFCAPTSKGIGLGYELMLLINDWARAEGLESVEGQVLRENVTMLELAEKLGFSIRNEPDDPEIKLVSLVLAGTEKEG